MAPTTARHPQPDLCRTVPADSSAPLLLREACQRWLQRLGWPDAEAGDLLEAAYEAVTNVVEHAYRPPVAHQLHELVWFEATHTSHPSGHRRVIISVVDAGRWKPAPGDSGGGLTRIRNRLATLDIEARETGTTVRLTSHPVARGSRIGASARVTARPGLGAPHVPTPRAPRVAPPPVACSASTAAP
jgi:anti-sigma regulatory factor (Ser/Thr protein kinase)